MTSQQLNRQKFILAVLADGKARAKSELWSLYARAAAEQAVPKSEFLDILTTLKKQGVLAMTGPEQTLVRLVPGGDASALPPVNIAAAPSPEPEPPAVPSVLTPEEIHIDCLVNRARCLRAPEDKANFPYGHRYYTIASLSLAALCERTLLAGYQVVPGRFKWTVVGAKRVLRHSDAWKLQQLFLVDWDNPQEKTLEAFLANRPFLQDNAFLITESISSWRNGNGLRVRAVLCLTRAVNSLEARRWVTDALYAALPDCDRGALENIAAGGHGRKEAPHLKLGNLVAAAWLDAALAKGHSEKQRKERAQAARARQRARKREKGVVAAHREGDLPIEALAKTHPSEYLHDLGLERKYETAERENWGRPEKQGDSALDVFPDGDRWWIRVYAASVASPEYGKRIQFKRFYCYNAFQVDIATLSPKSQQWKSLQADLALRGFGTWNSEEAFQAPARAPENKPPRHYTRPIKLRSTAADVTPDDFCDVNDNAAAIVNAFETHLQSGADIPHYLILSFEMGSGKNHGMLTSLNALKKRALCIAPYHDLADEQVRKAAAFGIPAFRFRGRGYGFEASGLAAFPLPMREQDETLFKKKNVLCPVYDKVETYQKHRLASMAVCIECPLYNACKTEGYHAQIADVARADFVAICLQDLLFNPAFWPFLNTLRAGEAPPSLEADALDAAMGVNSEPVINNDFDIAIIDEVTAPGLFKTAGCAIWEINALVEVWEGTAVGRLASGLQKALEQKTAPEHFAMLKKAVTDLDDTERAACNRLLTMHALQGTVVPHELRDRETGEVLSLFKINVPNAGLQAVHIPVSENAAARLASKPLDSLAWEDMPALNWKSGMRAHVPVSPYAALKAGVALNELTPIWHPGWTLLHQLQAFVTYQKNEAQPACSLEKGQLVFSIPPQVNAAMPKVVLMSGTTDAIFIQRAFDGQDVQFTVATGNRAAWREGTRAYQYVNARITTEGVFEFQKDNAGQRVFDEDGKPLKTGVTDRARAFLKKVVQFSNADGRRAVFMSYKDFVKGPLSTLPEIEALREAGIHVSHFDEMRGQDFGIFHVFHVFGYPKAEPEVVKARAISQFASDATPLTFEYENDARISAAGAAWEQEGGRYIDARVEQVRQQLTTETLAQALYRARPQRREGTVTILWSSEGIAGWTERARLFTFEDLTDTASVDTLDEAITAREAREALIKDTSIPAREVAEKTGWPERKVYHLRAQVSKGEPRRRDRILALHGEGLKPKEIAERVGITPDAVRKALKRAKS